MAYFPADERTLAYLATTGRRESTLTIARAYLTAQNMLHTPELSPPRYDELLHLDLAEVERTMAGPSRPHQTFAVSELPANAPISRSTDSGALRDGDVVIAAITSCTNTSNPPKAMIAAGLLARNAVERGLTRAPWTKTSLTPGSRETADLLQSAGLQNALDQLGFHVTGFGCGTCMGNSGPLDAGGVTEQIHQHALSVAAVLSGNRNFPGGRVHPDVAHSYLASPPMVVAMAIAGRTSISLQDEPIATDRDGNPVLLEEIWPTDGAIEAVVRRNAERARNHVKPLPLTTAKWQSLPHPVDDTYTWDGEAGMIRRPPFTDPALTRPVVNGDILAARPLLVLGDGITTDHISPVARILPDSPAGQWLTERGVAPDDFGSYSARRLNHDVMLRGASPTRDSRTNSLPARPAHGRGCSLTERSFPFMRQPTSTRTGGEYLPWSSQALLRGGRICPGLGSESHSPPWHSSGHRPELRTHPPHKSRRPGCVASRVSTTVTRRLIGDEEIEIIGLTAGLGVRTPVLVKIRDATGGERMFDARARIDTSVEAEWIRAGGGLIAHSRGLAAK